MWLFKGQTFSVPVGSLGFSVVVYVICASLCLLVLLIRRFSSAMGRAELGGPAVPRYLTAGLFILLWLVYIILSSLQAYEHI